MAIIIITQLDSYYLDRLFGFMKLITNYTIIPRIILLRAEAIDETISRALLIRTVRFTVPQAATVVESVEKIFYSQKQYKRF